ELVQRASVLMTQVSGVSGLARQLEALRVGSNIAPLGSEFDLISMPLYLNSRATTIYAGSNEVQRDLISRSMAGA
ncbi:MAG: acyl-CoA dehydrogenase family protein, partial [Pseudomonadota bacterium]